jgi:ankyrin repeat protein
LGQKGIDVDAIDNLGRTPLMYALKQREINESIIIELLYSEADINAVDYYGKSALMYAVERVGINEELIIKMLELGADINKETNSGLRPCDFLFIKVNNYIREKNIIIRSKTL